MFDCGNVASHMYFVVRGIVQYYLPSTSRREPARFVSMHRGTWLSEAVLWIHWVHRGSAVMAIDSEAAALSTRKFAQVTLKFPDACLLAKERSREFLRILELSQ